MNKSRIEWTNFSVNPIKGLCPVACKDNQGKEFCYARRMYRRFGWNPEIRYDPTAFKGLPSKPARVFVGSTMELFGDWVDRDWLHMTFTKCLSRPQHTFIFLTKKPENLADWSPFPENCWVGVSATNENMYNTALFYLNNIRATVRYISFEPLLEQMKAGALDFLRVTDWVIIGAETMNGKIVKAHAPKIEWVKEIVEAADKAGIPVFLKDNLKPLFRPGNLINGKLGCYEGIKGEPLELKLRQELK